MFTVSGAFVDSVCCLGPVTTYGPNNMALDNWGTVGRWGAEDKVTTYGPSGIGFVNFGAIGRLEINAPVETFGQGAHGSNVLQAWVIRFHRPAKDYGRLPGALAGLRSVVAAILTPAKAATLLQIA